MSTQSFDFHDIGRLPMAGDNVAIATRRLEAGTKIIYQAQSFRLSHTLLEGHRFAVQRIKTSEALLSWGLPFGVASQEIKAGAYVCNAGMLEARRGRRLEFELPIEANFEDKITPYLLDSQSTSAIERFKPSEPLALYEPQSKGTHWHSFMGYRRTPKRGVGTRNVIVLLGTTSRTASYVSKLAERLKGLADKYPNIDGIVAVAHTEGGHEQPTFFIFERHFRGEFGAR